MTQGKQYAPGLEEQVEEHEEKLAHIGDNVFGTELEEAGELEAREHQAMLDRESAKELSLDASGIDTYTHLHGIPVRRLTFASLALLSEVNSIFVRMDIGITPEEQEEMQALATEAETLSKKNPPRKLSKTKQKRMAELMARVYAEAEKQGNIFLEGLKFLAVMCSERTVEEIGQIIWNPDGSGQGKVRLLSLEIGERIELSEDNDASSLATTINEFILDQNKTRVEPVSQYEDSEKPEEKPGNG